MNNFRINIRIRIVLELLMVIAMVGLLNAQTAQKQLPAAEIMNAASSDTFTLSKIPLNPQDISPLLIGEKIPEAVLSDASGRDFDLKKAISEKPTVLVIYRGGWCPYCSKQLSGLQVLFPELKKIGYQLIAISTDVPKGLKASSDKQGLDYILLSDADLSLAKQFGIAYKAPKDYWEMLPRTTGGKDVDLLLPVPSVFLVDRKGVIQFEYINPDFRLRLNPELLKAVAISMRPYL